jgi:hypothetical protein
MVIAIRNDKTARFFDRINWRIGTEHQRKDPEQFCMSPADISQWILQISARFFFIGTTGTNSGMSTERRTPGHGCQEKAPAGPTVNGRRPFRYEKGKSRKTSQAFMNSFSEALADRSETAAGHHRGEKSHQTWNEEDRYN